MSSCNVTKLTAWKNFYYDNKILVNDKKFYRYQNVKGMALRKGLALDLVNQKCIEQLNNLYVYQTGRGGPVSVQIVYDAMCSTVCLESDNLHLSAMSATGCTCLELSTQPGDPTYRFPGDFCLENSARRLCNIIGVCDKWNCQLVDFMCPRYEYNKKYTKLKGFGSCLANSAESTLFSSYSMLLILLVSLLCLYLI